MNLGRQWDSRLKLMERYPEYRFLLCCPTLPEDMKNDYPGL